MNRKSETDRKVYVPLRLKPNDVAYLDVLAAGNRTKAVELCIETTRTIEEQLNEPNMKAETQRPTSPERTE